MTHFKIFFFMEKQHSYMVKRKDSETICYGSFPAWATYQLCIPGYIPELLCVSCSRVK